MIYVLAILLPPLAILVCGKPIQALLNLSLCVAFFPLAIVHAVVVAADGRAKKRDAQLMAAMAAGAPAAR